MGKPLLEETRRSSCRSDVTECVRLKVAVAVVWSVEREEGKVVEKSFGGVGASKAEAEMVG